MARRRRLNDAESCRGKTSNMSPRNEYTIQLLIVLDLQRRVQGPTVGISYLLESTGMVFPYSDMYPHGNLQCAYPQASVWSGSAIARWHAALVQFYFELHHHTITNPLHADRLEKDMQVHFSLSNFSLTAWPHSLQLGRR